MAAPLEITLFGPMQVRVEGQPFPKLRSRKALWLLAILALRDGAPATRERLAFALWPDTQTNTALANLRVVMSDLRNALGAQSQRLVAPDRGTLALDIQDITIDALEFDRAFNGRD
jgi:DNA-binding SARP family transcriptional activator